jgi:tRNA G10  N-methylase Trm11
MMHKKRYNPYLEVNALPYNPTYDTTPFTDFASITPATLLKSLNLNWKEQDLPERERTKHVHRLHPYLGKFIPQLAEIFLRKFRPKLVCDPFCGSGTTLVEAAAFGIDSVGCDISEFNCLLARVKTAYYDIHLLEHEIKDILSRLNLQLRGGLFSDHTLHFQTDSEYLKSWFHSKALQQLLCYRSLISNYQYQNVLKVILSRAARSSRLTTHYELDWPKKPQTEPYECYKHSRICQPTDDALQFLNRYSLDTLKRIKEFHKIRKNVSVNVIWGDARNVNFPSGIDLVLTSPPYVGIIDYHEQHRYAYELLDFSWRAEEEIGPAFKGNSKTVQKQYIEQIAAVFANLRHSLSSNATMVIIVNDRHGLYNDWFSELGFVLEEKLERHVNRRTGMRSNDFYESILVWRREEN